MHHATHQVIDSAVGSTKRFNITTGFRINSSAFVFIHVPRSPLKLLAKHATRRVNLQCLSQIFQLKETSRTECNLDLNFVFPRDTHHQVTVFVKVHKRHVVFVRT